MIHSSASAIAEMASCLVLAPAEIIKQNAQMIQQDTSNSTKQNKASSSLQVFKQMRKTASARQLFSGYAALLARNLPFTALQFPIFEYIRSKRREKRKKDASQKEYLSSRALLQTGFDSGLSAATAGALAAWVTTPSDVVKTRIMLTAGQSGENGDKGSVRKGPWEATREVYEQGGIRGFFRGALLRSVWTAVGSGLYLGTYDVARLWLQERKGERM